VAAPPLAVWLGVSCCAGRSLRDPRVFRNRPSWAGGRTAPGWARIPRLIWRCSDLPPWAVPRCVAKHARQGRRANCPRLAPVSGANPRQFGHAAMGGAGKRCETRAACAPGRAAVWRSCGAAEQPPRRRCRAGADEEDRKGDAPPVGHTPHCPARRCSEHARRVRATREHARRVPGPREAGARAKSAGAARSGSMRGECPRRAKRSARGECPRRAKRERPRRAAACRRPRAACPVVQRARALRRQSRRRRDAVDALAVPQLQH
jgi:hypothetical protein